MAARSPLRLNEISESILRQLIAEYRQVLDEHPDLELAIRSILDSAVGADGAVHITDEVDRQLVDLIADARFNKVARETGRALRDELGRERPTLTSAGRSAALDGSDRHGWRRSRVPMKTPTQASAVRHHI